MQTKTTSDIQIRLVEGIDAGAIAALLFESFAEYESLYTPEGFAATAIAPEQIRKCIAEGSVWVAVCGEMIAGTIFVIPKGTPFT